MPYNPRAKKQPPEKRYQDLLDQIEKEIRQGIYRCSSIPTPRQLDGTSSKLKNRAKKLLSKCENEARK